MSIRLIALDLDNTLLDPDASIAEETLAALRSAQERGVVVCIATGRILGTAMKYMKQIGPNTAALAFNGAVIADAEGNCLSESDLSEEQVRSLIGFAGKRDLFIQFYEGDTFIVEDMSVSRRKDVNTLASPIREVGDFSGYPVHASPKMLIECAPESREGIIRELKEEFAGTINVSSSETFLIEVTNSDTNKGNALAILCGKLGIAREDVMACGDNWNDASMVEWAGVGVAVSNAVPELKAIADYVTEAPMSLGVGEAVRRFCGVQ